MRQVAGLLLLVLIIAAYFHRGVFHNDIQVSGPADVLWLEAAALQEKEEMEEAKAFLESGGRLYVGGEKMDNKRVAEILEVFDFELPVSLVGTREVWALGIEGPQEMPGLDFVLAPAEEAAPPAEEALPSPVQYLEEEESLFLPAVSANFASRGYIKGTWLYAAGGVQRASHLFFCEESRHWLVRHRVFIWSTEAGLAPSYYLGQDYAGFGQQNLVDFYPREDKPARPLLDYRDLRWVSGIGSTWELKTLEGPEKKAVSWEFTPVYAYWDDGVKLEYALRICPGENLNFSLSSAHTIGFRDWKRQQEFVFSQEGFILKEWGFCCHDLL